MLKILLDFLARECRTFECSKFGEPLERYFAVDDVAEVLDVPTTITGEVPACFHMDPAGGPSICIGDTLTVIRLALFGKARQAIRFQQWASGDLIPEILALGACRPPVSIIATRN